MTPELLIAGHIVKDVTADGWRPGGGALYATAQARRLGLNVGVITACAPEVDPKALLPDVAWHVQPSAETTTFENRYEGGKRSQRLLAHGQAIDFREAPPDWLKAPMILLTPLFHEIEPADVKRLQSGGALLGLSAQGWLRELDGDRVSSARFEAAPAWLGGDLVFLSDEDLEDAERVAIWQQRVPVVALTHGRGGCTVWDAAGRHAVTAASVCETDPTGAGDVFAAAFLVRYYETRDVLLAAAFACAAGALSVRGEGLEAIGGRQEIETLLSQGQVRVA